MATPILFGGARGRGGRGEEEQERIRKGLNKVYLKDKDYLKSSLIFLHMRAREGNEK